MIPSAPASMARSMRFFKYSRQPDLDRSAMYRVTLPIFV